MIYFLTGVIVVYTMSDKKVQFGKTIKLLREEKGFSQEDIAGLLKIPRPSVSQLESGQRDISMSEFTVLLGIFQITYEDFMNLNKTDNKAPGALQKYVNKKIKFNPNKFKNLILYILEKCGSKPNVGETVLYKLLYFCDFDYFELYEKPLTGMLYKKMQFGPVPKQELFNATIKEMVKNQQITIINLPLGDKFIQRKYINFLSPDLSFFNLQEIELVNKVISRLSDMSARQIEDHAHQDYPWIIKKEGEEMDYADVFNRTGEHAQLDYDAMWQDAGMRDAIKDLGEMSKEEYEYYLKLLNKNERV